MSAWITAIQDRFAGQLGRREQTDDEHAAGLDGHGTHLLHCERLFPCFCELAIVLEESPESGVDIGHSCYGIRGYGGMRLGSRIGSKNVEARPEGVLYTI